MEGLGGAGGKPGKSGLRARAFKATSGAADSRPGSACLGGPYEAMQVTVAASGSDYALEHAQALFACGALRRLHADTVAHGLPLELVDSGRRPSRARGRLRRLFAGREGGGAAFDRRMAARLDGSADVFLGSAGAGLSALRRARELGLVTVLACPTAHVLQRHEALLRASVALRRRNVAGMPTPRRIERELHEVAEAARVLVPGSFVLRTFLDAGVPAAKLALVQPAVQLGGLAPAAEPPRGLHLVHVGPVAVRFGCQQLLQAFAELVLPGATLAFVGEVHAEMRPHLARWGDAGVALIPPASPPELARILRTRTVFCRLSLDEGFAPCLVQAMAAGLAVLATPASGAEDLCSTEHGELVPAGDVEALKERLLAAWRDPDLVRSQGAAAARRARELALEPPPGASVADVCAAAVAEERAGAETRLLRHGWKRVA